MDLTLGSQELPDSQSSELCLCHPTEEECVAIWTNTSSAWKDTLDVAAYIEERLIMKSSPLAKSDGLTTWVLVDKNLAPNQRRILSSCGSLRKRVIISDGDGNVSETIVHGILAVFCPPAYRSRGYTSRMMSDLSRILSSWQSEGIKCAGSILYSDIGKSFYARFGWQPSPTNTHIVFRSSKCSNQNPVSAKEVLLEDLPELCEKDELMIKSYMAIPAEGSKGRVSVVPDVAHMMWHIPKEEFCCNRLFGKIPHAKGAIAGPLGSRVWVIWTHRYYSNPAEEKGDNKLLILRLVVENQEMGVVDSSDSREDLRTAQLQQQAGYLKAVLEAAQNEAAEWKLSHINLWHPTPGVQKLVNLTEIPYSVVEDRERPIESALWYDENGEPGAALEWINDEVYAYC